MPPERRAPQSDADLDALKATAFTQAAAEPPPLVTVVPDHGRRVIAGLDARAQAAGVAIGMTLTKARMLAGPLDARDGDPQADLEGLRRLALWAGQRYAPHVAPCPPDGLWLDITGCAHLFDGETPLLRDLHRRLSAFGLTVQIAVADTPGCAHAVARHVPAGRPVAILPGDHRKALALLPVAALRLEPLMVEALRKLGFERIEQLIVTARAPLAKRFGPGLHRRLDQAMGLIPEPIDPVFPDHIPAARRGFLEPIATAPAFAQVISDLVADVTGQLLREAKGARRLDCWFHRVDGEHQAIRVGTASPSRDPKHLAKLLTAKIETVEPGLGIEAMTLIAPLVEPLGSAQSAIAIDRTIRRPAPDLPALVDALANRFGARRLYRSSPRASAMPERSIALTSPLAKPQNRAWNLDAPRPARMLDPPEPVEVIAMLPDHPPAQFVWRRERHRVTQADGPERLHGEWWRDAGHEAAILFAVRDYYQVETASGGRYWLFRLGDGENPATGTMHWFIHGAFA